MSKRFTDTEKWKKRFIKSLDPVLKLLWIYITDTCDNAGVWHYEPEIAEVRIGASVDWSKARDAFASKVYIFDAGEKWFIPSFVDFQCKGELNPNNRFHASIIRELDRYGLQSIYEKYLINESRNYSLSLKCPDQSAKLSSEEVLTGKIIVQKEEEYNSSKYENHKIKSKGKGYLSPLQGAKDKDTHTNSIKVYTNKLNSINRADSDISPPDCYLDTSSVDDVKAAIQDWIRQNKRTWDMKKAGMMIPENLDKKFYTDVLHEFACWIVGGNAVAPNLVIDIYLKWLNREYKRNGWKSQY